MQTGAQSISRLNTVDQGGWGSQQSSNPAMLVAWLVAGFNIGVVLIIVLALVVLPALIPDLSIQRDTANASGPGVAVVYVTNTPTATLPATATPTLTPTMIPITNTPMPTSSTAPLPTATQLVMTLASDFEITEPTLIPPTATPVPPPSSYELDGITFHQQGWNNCGPANLAMGLSFYGWEGTQTDTASYLKPEREDRNVSPVQMVDYVHQFTSLRAIWRMDGDMDLIRWLVSNEFVVIVESGYDPGNAEGWYGHYETIVSYDDVDGTITVYDSYLGRPSRPTLTRSQAAFDSDWQGFNRNYIVIYPAERELELQAQLGPDWIEATNRRNAAETARQEASQDPDNPFTWFNLGTSLVSLGLYDEAVVAYSKAFELNMPYRMMWYQFGPYEALLQTGRLDDVLDLANDTLSTSVGGRYVEETYYYKGRVYEIQGDYAAAAEQYTLALNINSNYSQAQIALRRVES